mgnify:CR=1 FL=1
MQARLAGECATSTRQVQTGQQQRLSSEPTQMSPKHSAVTTEMIIQVQHHYQVQ